jgi:hypothetical protein
MSGDACADPGYSKSTLQSTDRLDELASEALRRLKDNHTYEDWRAVGRKLVAITEEVMLEFQLTEWDQNNRALTRDAVKRFEEWETSVSNNEKPMSKQERWALRELMTNPKIDAYYATLTGSQRRRLNHPNAIINHWKRHRVKKPSAPRRSTINFEFAVDTVRTGLKAMDTDTRRAVLEQITAPFKDDLKEENDSAIPETIREFVMIDLDDWIECRTEFDPKFSEMVRKFMVLANREMDFSTEEE